MSIGSIGKYDAYTAAQSGKSVGNDVRAKQLQAAFDSQMSMAQQLFGEGSNGYGEGRSSGGFDMSLINDSMMIEALTTLTRLMKDEAGIARQSPVRSSTPTPKAAPQVTEPTVAGGLSAQFESGNEGVSAIGYDRVGGTSYGKYQIASKPGTMDRFLSYLDENAPEWGARLREAGPANTGSKEGGMPREWQAIASEDSEKFGQLQHNFIASETYDPARSMILDQTGFDFNKAPAVLKEVLWSTAVQHGPTGAAKIFNRVIDRFTDDSKSEDFNASLIEGVYDSRKNQFGSSSKRVQRAVANRMESEKQLALNMLNQPKLNRIV